jgi:alpha-glucosidase
MRVVTSAVACSAVALFLHGCGSQSNSFESTEHGIKVSNSDGDVQVEVAVEGEQSFRVSINHGSAPVQKLSQMIVKKSSFSAHKVTEDEDTVTVEAPFGSATIAKDCSSFELRDAVGNSLLKSATLSELAVSKGSNFLKVTLDKANHGQKSIFVGAGADAGAPLTHDHSTPTVSNTYGVGSHSWAPQYYSLTDSYGALAVGTHDWSNLTEYWTSKDESDPQPDFAKYPANWTSTDAGVQWVVLGNSVDLYLMPANNTYTYLKAHAELTGKPRVPPRYAFGFFAGRWGWTTEEYIDTTLQQFRDGNFPADAFISDFFFFTEFNDYAVPPEGNSSYQDFGWNPKTFPDPVTQLAKYKDLGFKFGGIRKPRFGNPKYLNTLQGNGWLLPEGLFNVNGQGRNMNYTTQESKDWYQEENQHYLEEGVSFWWNDEGEVYYFQFQDWNLAQEAGFKKLENGNKRFFSLNRVYTPGLQHLGAGVWTGDVAVSWEALSQQPGYMLNYNLAGNVYLGCDTGGFVGPNATGELLSRWYWSSAFFTIMRVHSSFDYSEHADAGLPITPHFPFMYEEQYASAMRAALEMRYQLIPMMYSLGHLAWTEGAPITRPLFMEFPLDAQVMVIDSQWLIGTGLMTAPVLAEGGKRTVYFPELPSNQLWFVFNSTTTAAPSGTEKNFTVPLDETLLFARSGTLVPLGPVVQHTGELPGDGVLTVHVYAGSDGEFVLFEDDGETRNYESGAVRETSFRWNDNAMNLTWHVSNGKLKDASMFSKVKAVLFASGSEREETSAALGSDGCISFQTTLVV